MVIGLVACGLTAGCAFDDGDARGPAVTPPGGAVVASPFSPAGLRVLPLTHFERTDEGRDRVMLFFELVDQWGDTVKGAGRLEIRVSPEGDGPVSGPMSGGGASARANAGPASSEWKIDLTDLDRNASLYDPSTRAYRLALKDLPRWMRAIASPEGQASESVGGGAAIEVYFRTVGADGRPAVLRDRFVLRRSS